MVLDKAVYYLLLYSVVTLVIAEIVNLQVGCNIGGLFFNTLAYADDNYLIPLGLRYRNS